MREFFLVTKLKHRMADYLKRSSIPVHTADLFWELRPYVALHGIELTDRGFILPSLSPENTSEVFYSDQILGISTCRSGALLLYMNNGDICMLSRHSSVRKRMHISERQLLGLAYAEIKLRLWKLRESLLY